jgi:hypothetical protein
LSSHAAGEWRIESSHQEIAVWPYETAEIFRYAGRAWNSGGELLEALVESVARR